MTAKKTTLTPEGVKTEDYTAEELKQAEVDKAASEEYIKKKYDYKAKVKTDKEAGNAKLLSLGLTQDQVTALTGYDPNV